MTMTRMMVLAAVMTALVVSFAGLAVAQGASKVPCSAVEGQYGLLFPGVGGNAVITGNGDLNTDPCTSRLSETQYGS